MRPILLPLIAASLFAFSVVAVVVAAEPTNQVPFVDQIQKNADNVRTRQPVGTIYAYWPNKKDEDPSTRIIEIAGDDGRIQPYRAIYKDPQNNAYDLSDPEETYAGLVASDDQFKASNAYGIAPEFAANSMDAHILFSVYLDGEDKPVYTLPGREVPSSWRDMRTYHQVTSRRMIEQVDPSTPGYEEIKDPGAAMAQQLLNSIAMQGPGALESVKTNPVYVKALDAAYEMSRKYEQTMAEMDAKVEAEEAGR
ncbi:hypothetical protein BGZ70_000531 [Mortierella alpina]|uniref:Uncharacterized protein n=1 Tax=Mortierella alpina TaxID=64518 RepID=A0A9P6LYM9_MORAP|nr:hypothetical protein BGZ70_000531 [Mortierella alpina]